MYTASEPLILASTSPRRRELLGETGVAFEIVAPQFEEDVREGELAKHMVARLAEGKAREVSERLSSRWVIGADTTVLIKGSILGKPVDVEDAERMLSLLSGSTHTVWSAFAVLHKMKEVTKVVAVRTDVTMATISPEKIRAYVATGEPMDKAGAYAIQGLGGHLVKEIHGSYSNVVGLDISFLIQTLLEVGALE